MTSLQSKTEKFLVATASILLFVLVFSFFSKDSTGMMTVFAKSEDSNSETSQSSEESEDDERSESSEGNEESEDDEESEYGEESEYYSATSDNSEEEVLDSVDGTATVVDSELVESVGVIQGENEQDMVEQSEVTALEERLESSEEVVMISVDGFDETVSVDGNTAIVVKKEKLFGIFQVSIYSQVTLDEQGNVIDEKKNIWNGLLSLFSF